MVSAHRTSVMAALQEPALCNTLSHHATSKPADTVWPTTEVDRLPKDASRQLNLVSGMRVTQSRKRTKITRNTNQKRKS